MIFFLQFFTKNSLHYPLSVDVSFKFLALILFEITHLQNFIPCFLKGRHFTRGDNSKTSSPKGNDAHLRAIIQSEKKRKHQFFRCLRAANSVVRGRIWPNFKLIQALMYVIITCKYEKDPITNNLEKVATPFFKL